jgi:ankyrin repeat protein
MRTSAAEPGSQHAGRRVARFFCALAAVVLLLASGAPAQNTASNPRQISMLDQRDAHGLTPLIAAAAAGRTDTVHTLLAQGASVDATAADGRTALIAATQAGQTDAVRALIAAGANVNWSARSTGTALNMAENRGETAIAALLRAAGARSTGKSVGDTVCVRPWSGSGFCGTVQSFSVRSVQIQISRIVGCTNGCTARPDCSAGLVVGGANGLQTGDTVAVPSWCLTQTGVRP